MFLNIYTLKKINTKSKPHGVGARYRSAEAPPGYQDFGRGGGWGWSLWSYLGFFHTAARRNPLSYWCWPPRRAETRHDYYDYGKRKWKSKKVLFHTSIPSNEVSSRGFTNFFSSFSAPQRQWYKKNEQKEKWNIMNERYQSALWMYF